MLTYNVPVDLITIFFLTNNIESIFWALDLGFEGLRKMHDSRKLSIAYGSKVTANMPKIGNS